MQESGREVHEVGLSTQEGVTLLHHQAKAAQLTACTWPNPPF